MTSNPVMSWFSWRPTNITIRFPARDGRNFLKMSIAAELKIFLKKMRADGASEMVFFSTDMVYGKPQYLPVDAGHPQQPFGYYGASKKKAEDICRKFRDRG